MSTTYAIFGGSIYYPSGGFKDIYGLCETFQEALIIYEEALTVGTKHTNDWWDPEPSSIQYHKCDWAHIVNLKTKKIVVDSKSMPMK